MSLIDIRKIAIFTLLAMSFSIFPVGQKVGAVSIGTVVINEIAWAGSADSASDEYIELYNTGTVPVDLAGWMIDDDDLSNKYLITSGIIAPNSYFLIESREDAVKSVLADQIVALSLANSGDKLLLKDSLGSVIDSVNTSGGAWFAGNATNKTSMERIDAKISDDIASNWAENKSDNGSYSSGGALIKGTPRAFNSVSVLPPTAPKAWLSVSDGDYEVGDVFELNVEVANLDDVFAYGFDINYDSLVLKHIKTEKGEFLNKSGTESTSFQAALEDGREGRLIVGEARTAQAKTGVSGGGNLFRSSFEVIGGKGNSSIGIAGSSFMSGLSSDIAVNFVGLEIVVTEVIEPVGTDPVLNLTAKEGAKRYEITLNWNSPISGADEYKILRKNSSGTFVELGRVALNSFIDGDSISSGGRIIPDVAYTYKVVAIKGGKESVGLDIVAKEARGIRGDNNRSDRVDGRDLESLGRHFAENVVDSSFNSLVDTSFDGKIDGIDLLDLAANWAKTYSSV